MNKQRKNYGTLTVIGAFLLATGYGSVAFAQTAPTTVPTTTPSNYATDVAAGQATLAADPVAATSAKEVNDSESDNGGVDSEPAEVKEAIEPDEAVEAKDSGSESGDSSESGGSQTSGGGESGGNGSNGGTAGDQQ